LFSIEEGGGAGVLSQLDEILQALEYELKLSDAGKPEPMDPEVLQMYSQLLICIHIQDHERLKRPPQSNMFIKLPISASSAEYEVMCMLSVVHHVEAKDYINVSLPAYAIPSRVQLTPRKGTNHAVRQLG